MKTFGPKEPYTISANTLILQAFRNEPRVHTLIIENQQKAVARLKPFEVIQQSCVAFGTTYARISQNSKELFNHRKKLPIVLGIDQGTPLILIPTIAPTSHLNTWMMLHAIVNYHPVENGFTKVDLINGESVIVDSSEATIHRQIATAYILKRDYHQKILEFNRSLRNFSALPL